MDDAVMRKFVEIFARDNDWSRSHRLARRAGLMIFLRPKKDHDWLTGVFYDPEVHVIQPRFEPHFEADTPMAWRRDFVERVVAMGCVPNLEDYPPVSDFF
jgi:hypothetical protein